MALNRRLVRAMAFFVPLGMFLAAPFVAARASSIYFLYYILGYVAVGCLLALLKWKVDGRWGW